MGINVRGVHSGAHERVWQRAVEPMLVNARAVWAARSRGSQGCPFIVGEKL